MLKIDLPQNMISTYSSLYFVCIMYLCKLPPCVFFYNTSVSCLFVLFSLFLSTMWIKSEIWTLWTYVCWFSQRTTKQTIGPVWPAKTQISLYILLVWLVFSFIPLWIARRLLKAHAISEDSDQTARMSKPVFLVKYGNVINLSSAELATWMTQIYWTFDIYDRICPV